MPPKKKKPPTEPPPGYPQLSDNILQAVLHYLVPEASIQDPAHRRMTVPLPTGPIHATALLDSGALHASMSARSL